MVLSVIWMLSQAWSIIGIISLDNRNYLALVGAAALALVGPRTKVNGSAFFSWILFSASAAYLTFNVRFASSP
jgi:hypothetical protein